MYIDDLTNAVVACAEAEGWKVEAGIYYKEQKAEFEFGKYSPAGRNFSFKVEMKCANIISLIDNIDRYYNKFDIDYETCIFWLNQWRYGKKGAPRGIMAVLEDSEAIKNMVGKLLFAIKFMEVPEEY